MPFPDLAIGRLPATTLDQAQAMVAKVLDWEAQGHNLDGPAALVADNPDLAGDFEADARDIESAFLGGRDTTEVFLAQLPNRDMARARILDAFDQGLSLISYVGHGGGAVWAGENILNSSDPSALLAQPRQPLHAHHELPQRLLHRALLRVPRRGIPQGAGQGHDRLLLTQRPEPRRTGPSLHRAVMRRSPADSSPRIGDAILAAQKTYAQSGAFPELLSLYHLFGDPAMKAR